MIRPTFLGFETAKRGINTSQKGLDITGQNLVNWDSRGYTRQRIEQVALSPSSYSNRFGSNRIGVSGQGVDIVGISQMRDSFLDKRYREESAEGGYFEQTNVILSDIQDSIDMLDAEGDSGLRGRLMALLDSLDVFAGAPDSPTNANIVSTNAKSMAQTLQLFSQKLSAITGQQTYDMSIEVDTFNNKLSRVAELNRIIMEDNGVIGDDARYQPNELFDERNRLVDELSQMADLQVLGNADGTITIEVSGHVAVQGKKFDSIAMDVDDKTGVTSMKWLSSGENIKLNSGSLKSYRDYVNGRGENILNPGETSERGILYYKDQLDSFANTFADIMNNTIPQDLAAPDGPYKTLISAADGSTILTAENISISEDWAKDSSFIITKKGDLDSTHILNLKNKLKSGSNDFTVAGNDVFEGSLLDFLKGIGTTLGSDVSYNDGRQEASGFIIGSLEDRRDSVSGVNVDEETANMMLYQKSLQASSRLMTTLDEALDVLINKTGMVGR